MKYASVLAAALALAACSGDEASNVTAAASPVAAIPAPAGRSWTETVAKTEEGYIIGNPNAPIKLVEYGARTCPACGAFAREAFQPLINNYVANGKVSFEFRDFMIHGAPDIALALLGTCGSTESFFPILEQQYGNQAQFLDRLQALSPAQQQALQGRPPTQVAATLAEAMGAIDFIKQRGIPEAQARQCLTNQQKLEALVKPTEAATESGKVTGTPTFFINDEPVPGVLGWAQLEQALKRAGA